MKVSVSYLKNKFGIEETLKELDETTCDYIHVDLMDGEFAGERNYEIEDILKKLSFIKKPLDIHCMIKDPIKEIEQLAILNPEYITVHKEIDSLEKCLKLIKGLGIKCGIAINPETTVKSLENELKSVDLVLVMSVNPGKGGQPFQKEAIDKLKELKKIREEKKLNYLISIDGGINEDTIKDVYKNTDMVVSGSYVCMEKNLEEKIQKLKKIA